MTRVRELSRNYDPKQVEEKVLRFWEEKNVYSTLRESLRGRPKYYFLDGPPYPSSGEPHPGTVWNKVLKDVFIRFARASGYDVIDRAGWDCHGLPIEVKTEQMLGFKTKRDVEAYGIANFVDSCKKFAEENIAEMTKHFKNFGASLNWVDAYRTMDDYYIESAWWGIKKIWEQGRLKRGLQVVHWCPRCETVLADYEVSEYKDLRDPSIYVRFPLKERPGESLLIWTTTPWTLPANVAVMVHPDETYVKVRVKQNLIILMEARLEAVASELGWEDYEIVDRFPGSKLEGLAYEHPLKKLVPALKNLERGHVVVLSSKYVSREEGTGCVHAAPGHGQEDYEEVHLHYGLPVLSPVDDSGRFTEEAGPYAGIPVRDANSKIISDLDDLGALAGASFIVHRYPVCWRCKTPLIIRATEQWFIQLSDLKEKLLSEMERVKWTPGWAKTRFRNWLEELRDWVISRQRFWGTPLPIWICEKCGWTTVVGSLDELHELSGTRPPDLHRPWVDEVTFTCPKCGGTVRRVPDVVDVWYDSGISFFASLGYPKKKEDFERLFPADFITEGHDQTRGWFFSLLRMGVLLFGRAPYESVLVHGFMLDEKGREMHKSLGNFEPPDKIVAEVGRDAFRLFVMTRTPWSDIRFVWKDLKNAVRTLNVIWNVYSFASTYLAGADVEESLVDEKFDELPPEDRWILSRAASTRDKLVEAMSELSPHEALSAVLEFYVEDLSHLYIHAVRKVLRKEGEEKKLKGAVLLTALKYVLPLLAIFTPFIAEEIYQASLRQQSDPESVHMLPLPPPKPEWISQELESGMNYVREVIRAGLQARASAGVKRRAPLRSVVIVTEDESLKKAVTTFKEVIKTELNVHEVLLSDTPPEGKWTMAEISAGSVFVPSELGPEERLEWIAREVLRRIQQTRKEMGLTVGRELVEVYLWAEEADVKRAVSNYEGEIAEESGTVALRFISSPSDAPADAHGKVWDIEGMKVGIWVVKVEGRGLGQ